MYPCTQETLQQPQSIVHHLSRMGSKVVVPLRKKCSVARRRKLKSQRCSRHDDEDDFKQPKRAFGSSSRTEPASVYDSHDDASTFDCSNESTREHCALHEEEVEESDFFIPLDQNEFLIECFMANDRSDVTFIVLFCAGQCSFSEQLEEIILTRTMEPKSNCLYRRVDSRMAPMFTRKLQVDEEQPTLVAIQNGKVVGKLSNISSACWELEKWLMDTNILTQRGNESNFRNISTRSY